MNAGRVYVVCNALDDNTRTRRGIVTDSPAASRKVFQMCAALRQAGVQACVLSLGRGRTNGQWRHHTAAVERVQGVPVMYAPFWQVKGLSEAVSLLAPAAALWQLARHRRARQVQTVVFYNPEPAYLVALVLARLLGLRCTLDLEDGRTHRDLRSLRGWVIEATLRMYEALCNAGAMLACSALAAATRLRPTMCYYGLSQPTEAKARWQAERVTAVLGGTLDPSTGADLLVATVRHLRASRPAWAEHLVLAITGKGQTLVEFQQLAQEPGHPTVIVHGRTTDLEYRAILDGAEIGLALKPRHGALAQTTFPSKVVELASAGLLVISTDISDVRTVLGDGALYLVQEDSEGLAALLGWAVQQRVQASATAEVGCQRVAKRCAPGAAGRELATFLCQGLPMNRNATLVAWQPVLTDHAAYTLEALASRSGGPLHCMVLRAEDPVRKAQGWLDTQVTSIDRQQLSPSLSWLGLWRLLLSQRQAVHLFGSPFDQPRMMRALFLAALMGLDYYLISEPYSPGHHGYFGDGQHWLNRLKSVLRPWVYRFYGLTVGRRARGIFAISALAINQYRQAGVRRERLLPFGYFVPAATGVTMAAPARAPFEASGAMLRVVFVGSLIKRKGVDLLVTAVRQLRAEGLDVRFNAFGPGSADGLGFDGQALRHCGTIAFGQAQQTMAGHDVLVLPSLYDGWGVVVNEALLAGVPAVCSDAVGAKVLVETYGAGVVFPNGDAVALAECLRALLQNTALLQASRQGARRAASAITPDAAASYMWEVICQRNQSLQPPPSPWYRDAAN